MERRVGSAGVDRLRVDGGGQLASGDLFAARISVALTFTILLGVLPGLLLGAVLALRQLVRRARATQLRKAEATTILDPQRPPNPTERVLDAVAIRYTF